jgi:acyl transferase domain-containing protein
MSDESLVAALRAALKENERLRRLTESAPEPIAIIGMGCRYPGGVRNPRDLWEVVATGADAIGPYPENRGWAGETRGREAGFIDADLFDARFFGISPREALGMSPQQRVLLETAWETLEHARVLPDSLRGSRTGVFVGTLAQDYETGSALGGREEFERYPMTALATGMLSGRIAGALDLRGPAITLDTACTSSLVAVHLACQSLRSGECQAAFAGGVRVIFTPDFFTVLGRYGQAAPDGRAKSYDAHADGPGWAEGAGLLLLEKLSVAQANNHRVLAVIRGSALSHVGARANGVTAPHGPTQREAIHGALVDARLTPDQVDVVDGNGTGTPWGDSIEIQALMDTYGADRPVGRPLRLGSVKSNLGHAQAAGSIASIIKMVEALKHGILPRSIHLDSPTPKVDWFTGGVEVLTENVPWPDTGRPRRAAVTSVGGNGTTAHLILEQAPPVAEPAQNTRVPPGALRFAVSAVTEPALRAQAAQLLRVVTEQRGIDLPDLAYSLATTRARFPRQVVITATTRPQLVDALTAVAEGRSHDRVEAGDIGIATTVAHEGARQLDLPTYPFQHRSFWPGADTEGSAQPCRTTVS